MNQCPTVLFNLNLRFRPADGNWSQETSEDHENNSKDLKMSLWKRLKI